MSTSVEPNPEQRELSSQAGQAESTTSEYTIEEIRGWDEFELLRNFIEKEFPKLEDTNKQMLLDNEITGAVFLNHAGDIAFFDRARFPLGFSDRLASLARDIIVGNKSKRCRSTSYTLRRQPANNAKGNSKQAELVESDTASKKARLDSDPVAKLPPLQKYFALLAQQLHMGYAPEMLFQMPHQLPDIISASLLKASGQASVRRTLIQDKVNSLETSSSQHPNSTNPKYSSFPLPNVVANFSDPKFEDKFEFPLVGSAAPTRFKLDKDSRW